MRTELMLFNLLPKDDQEICRKHFLQLGADSTYYSSLAEALRGSIDWEKITPESPDWFYFHYLMEEIEEQEKQQNNN